MSIATDITQFNTMVQPRKHFNIASNYFILQQCDCYRKKGYVQILCNQIQHWPPIFFCFSQSHHNYVYKILLSEEPLYFPLRLPKTSSFIQPKCDLILSSKQCNECGILTIPVEALLYMLVMTQDMYQRGKICLLTTQCFASSLA